MKWFETLDDKTRESIFSIMRTMSEESFELWRRARDLSPRFGEIAAGSADMDYVFKATATDSFLRGLRSGLNPEESMEKASKDSAEAINKWNTVGYKSRVSFGGGEALKRDPGSMECHVLGLFNRIKAKL